MEAIIRELDGNERPPPPKPSGDGARKYVTFHVNDAVWGFPLEDVREITRMPDVVRVPRSSTSLEGLANLRGRVLPITSLRRLLRFGDLPANEATRVVILDRGSPIGFVVDRMAALIAAAPDQLEAPDPIATEIGQEFLRGVVRGADGTSAVRILDADELLRRDFGKKAERKAVAPNLSGAEARRSAPQGDGAEASKLVLVSFDLGRQEYALPLDRVREILAFPGTVSAMPRADTAVLGVINLRDGLIPLLSLHALLGFPVPEISEQRPCVLVVSIGEKAIGLVADRTKEILRVDPGLVNPVPTMLSRGEGPAEVRSICRLDDGRRLVSVLAPEQLFGRDGISGPLPGGGNNGRIPMADGERAARNEEQFIVFRLDGEDYAVPIGAVDEITRLPDELTRIPKTPAFIEGLMNLRGTVLPLIDQRRRLALPHAERNGRQRVIVITFDGLKAGFIVDGVSELLNVPRAAIDPAPELSEDQVRLFSRVANLEEQNRMILIVDAPQLLNREELGLLRRLEQAAREPVD